MIHEAINADIAENKDTQLEKKEMEEPQLQNSEGVNSEEEKQEGLEEEDEDVGNGSESASPDMLYPVEAIRSKRVKKFKAATTNDDMEHVQSHHIRGSKTGKVDSTKTLNQDSYSGDAGKPLNAEKRHNSYEATCMERAEVRTLDQNMQILVLEVGLIGAGKESEAEPQPHHAPQVQVLDHEEDHVTQPENMQQAVDEPLRQIRQATTLILGL
ncbi:hypothetical protein Lal_00011220 [Lupinus albus]|nr:hypothetical protein Lal_00011220 [Lupinus albus]